MRADRLVAALLAHAGARPVTAAELAESWRCSVATARRDLEALSAAGIPSTRSRARWWLVVAGRRSYRI
ncbi:HTH domain-containing protein [Nonomuraea rubra]|uniref:HTH domain-containing protein n=1 Tax=Nonomuraea rubra TaxID=46180 RepID=UPI0031EE1B61